MENMDETPALVNLKEAARLAGVSRSTFYKRYVDTGKLSVITEQDPSGKAKRSVDVAEILRVFGKLHGTPDTSGAMSEDTYADAPETHERHTEKVISDTRTREAAALAVARLEAEKAGLVAMVEELRESRDREREEKARLLDRVSELSATVKMLAAPAVPPEAKGPEASRPGFPGYFARLFGRK